MSPEAMAAISAGPPWNSTISTVSPISSKKPASRAVTARDALPMLGMYATRSVAGSKLSPAASVASALLSSEAFSASAAAVVAAGAAVVAGSAALFPPHPANRVTAITDAITSPIVLLIKSSSCFSLPGNIYALPKSL